MALDFQLKTKELAACRDNFKLFERTYYGEQKKLRAEVHMKVSADFVEEISRLEAIIDRFKHPFGDDQAIIESYKAELADHVNGVLSEELQNQCTGGLMARIWTLENSMHCLFCVKLTKLLPYFSICATNTERAPCRRVGQNLALQAALQVCDHRELSTNGGGFPRGFGVPLQFGH